ncbi:hypothetical protein HEK616_07960 [Streptomyces nigrescens]|uniref:Uncharacterized protein n=1 Tax=Streptomyces nigrescens TaxID=1920 RepID=A0ABM7ZLP2_STRNI|nr:hypothetical protein HEK616_07960 [Streptomyces nigrescens]
MSWLAGCRRLHRSHERRAEHFLAFTVIGCSLICYPGLPNETTSNLCLGRRGQGTLILLRQLRRALV